MRLFVATCISLALLSLNLIAVGPATSQVAPTPSKRNFFWVFLTKGENNEMVKQMKPEEVKKMQADHVGNLGTLGKAGLALTAGPLGDNGFIRGIVLLKVDTKEQALDCFKNDPFVQNRILAVDCYPVRLNPSNVSKTYTPDKMRQYSLAIISKGANWKGKDGTAVDKLFANFKKISVEGEVAVPATFSQVGDRLGLLMLRASGVDHIKSLIETDNAVKQGKIQVTVHPLWLNDGILGSPKPLHLFDGKTFNGWEGDTKKTWRIENEGTDESYIVGGSLKEEVPHNNFLVTRRPFYNFELKLQVRLLGTGFVNGGIQFRSKRLTNPDYEMIGYQADMGEGYWGCLYDESRRNKVLAKPADEVLKKALKPNEWNDYVIRCVGTRVQLWLNGTLTVDYTETDASLPIAGLIGLQIHGGGKAEAHFKNIVLTELPL